MRNILIIAVLLFVAAISASAQIGTVKSVAIDTLDNTNPRTSDVVVVSGAYNSITFQALCTQLGGTSDGRLVLYGSVDGISYKALTSDVGWAIPNDTLTITNGAIWQMCVKNVPLKYYKVIGTGTSNDTTLITLKYVIK